MQHITFPRALRGAVRAEQSAESLFRQIQASLGDMRNAHSENIGEVRERVDNLSNSLDAIQRGLDPSGTGFSLIGEAQASWGQQVANSEELTALRDAAGRAKVQIPLTPRAEITSIATGAGPLIAPDRDGRIVGMPRRRLTIRALLGKATTSSNLVEYARQTDRENGAATVAEGALKPESDLGFELKQAKVATIAHWLKTSRQALDDAGQLRSIIDGELRYGLAVVEEAQLLLGDGVGICWA